MSGVPASLDVFRAVADPTRRALLDILRRSDRSVNELRIPFRMTQPAISAHLRILRDAGLVRATRVRRRRIYSLKPRPLRALFDWVMPYKSFMDPAGHVWVLSGAPGNLRSAKTASQTAHRKTVRKNKREKT